MKVVSYKSVGNAVALMLLGLLLQACGGGDEEAPLPIQTTAPTATVELAPTVEPGELTTNKLPPNYTEIAVTNGGTIRGRVTFLGTPPEQGVIQVTKDNSVFGDTISDEGLIVSRENEIKSVAVFITEITQGKPLSNSLPAVTNRNASFQDHVQVFYQGEMLIRSEDPVLHNTHPYFGRKEEGGRSCYNVAIRAEEGEVKEVRKDVCRPARQAGLYQLRCDAHDWMRGYRWLLEHPYGDTTSGDGAYLIDQVPPGTYTLKAWHEKLGEQEVEVTVGPGETLEVNFEFSS